MCGSWFDLPLQPVRQTIQSQVSLLPQVFTVATAGSSASQSALDVLNALRVARLCRLIRVFRVSSQGAVRRCRSTGGVHDELDVVTAWHCSVQC